MFKAVLCLISEAFLAGSLGLYPGGSSALLSPPSPGPPPPQAPPGGHPSFRPPSRDDLHPAHPSRHIEDNVRINTSASSTVTSASTSKVSPNSGERSSAGSGSAAQNKRHERHSHDSRDSRETSDSKASSCTSSGRSHSHSSSRSETHQTDKTGSCRHSHKDKDGTRNHRRHSHGEVHVQASPERRRSLEVKKEVIDIDPKIDPKNNIDANASHAAVQREVKDTNNVKSVENITNVKDEKCDSDITEQKETEAARATEGQSQSDKVSGKLTDNESVNGDNCKTSVDQKSNEVNSSLSVPEGDNNTSVKTERTSPVGANQSDNSPQKESTERTSSKESNGKLKDSSKDNETSQNECGKTDSESAKSDNQTKKVSSENKNAETSANKVSKELEKTSKNSDIVEVHNILPVSEIKKSSSPEKMGGEVSQTKAGRATASPDKAGCTRDTAGASGTVKLEKSAATPPSAKHTSSCTTSTPGKVLTSTGSDGVVYAVYPTGMFTMHYAILY